jgi:hypothetical protein
MVLLVGRVKSRHSRSAPSSQTPTPIFFGIGLASTLARKTGLSSDLMAQVLMMRFQNGLKIEGLQDFSLGIFFRIVASRSQHQVADSGERPHARQHKRSRSP